MSLRVLFFGNSESTFTNRHFQACLAGPAYIVGVVDVPPAKRTSTNTHGPLELRSFVDLAHWYDIPVFEPASPNLPDFVAVISRLAPDLLVAVGYTNRLQAPLLAVPRLGAVNFHASLLPAYRGKHPVFWALRAGEPWAGLTVHRMDSGLDTGDILYQVRARTRRDDSVSSLYDRIMAKSLALVPRLLADAATGPLRGRPQPEAGASYFSSIKPEDFRLDWSRPAEELRRWIAASPGQCYHEVAGRRLYCLDAQVVGCPAGLSPGTVVRIDKSGCTIAAGQGALSLRRARVESGSEITWQELRQELT